ncbi:MAG: type II toxin-antitoxin system prevent-host-death family antitoxin [Bryobacteraceae bacterium]
MANQATVRALKPPSQINVYEAKTHFSQILERVELGEEIVIARAGRPIAKLTAYIPDAPKSRQLGTLAGLISETPDAFDPAVDEEVAGLFEGPSGPESI